MTSCIEKFARYAFAISLISFVPLAIAQGVPEPSEDDVAPLPSTTLKSDAAALDDDGLDAELSFSSREIRENRVGGIALGAGTSEAWQTYSIYSELFMSADFVLNTSFGGGSFSYLDDHKDRDYKLKIQSRTLQIGARYFFTDTFPFYTQTSLGYTFWHIDSKPTGARDSDEDDLLRFVGDVNGPWIGQQLGLQFLWGSGVSADICLVGIAKSFIVSQDFTQSSSDGRTLTRRKIEAPFLWGLLNIKIGYVFN